MLITLESIRTEHVWMNAPMDFFLIIWTTASVGLPVARLFSVKTQPSSALKTVLLDIRTRELNNALQFVLLVTTDITEYAILSAQRSLQLCLLMILLAFVYLSVQTDYMVIFQL
jgi:hypothetical protein